MHFIIILNAFIIQNITHISLYNISYLIYKFLKYSLPYILLHYYRYFIKCMYIYVAVLVACDNLHEGKVSDGNKINIEGNRAPFLLV